MSDLCLDPTCQYCYDQTASDAPEWVAYRWDETIGKRVELSRVTAWDIDDVPVPDDGDGVILASIHDTGLDTLR